MVGISICLSSRGTLHSSAYPLPTSSCPGAACNDASMMVFILSLILIYMPLESLFSRSLGVGINWSTLESIYYKRLIWAGIVFVNCKYLTPIGGQHLSRRFPSKGLKLISHNLKNLHPYSNRMQSFVAGFDVFNKDLSNNECHP